jgi:hypothetical protein
MYEVHRLRNPIKRVNWLVIGGVAAAIGAGVWWMTKPAAASTTATPTPTPTPAVTPLPAPGVVTPPLSSVLPLAVPATGPVVTTLTPGGRYQIVGQYVPGQDPTLLYGIVGQQWQNPAVSISGTTYTAQATWAGPDGYAVPSGVTVTKIG